MDFLSFHSFLFFLLLLFVSFFIYIAYFSLTTWYSAKIDEDNKHTLDFEACVSDC